MLAYEMGDDEKPAEGRTHPWTTSHHLTPGRSYNFVISPHLVREVLEEFKPWERYPAVETFYSLIEQLNGQTSTLETSDCIFRGVQPNVSHRFPRSSKPSGE